MPWRLLFVDDVAEDVELATFALADWPDAWISQRVDTEAQLREALIGFNPDLVLSDFNLPGFSGEEALVCVQTHSPHTRFVFLTGMAAEALTHLPAQVWDKNRLDALPHLLDSVLSPSLPTAAAIAVETPLDDASLDIARAP